MFMYLTWTIFSLYSLGTICIDNDQSCFNCSLLIGSATLDWILILPSVYSNEVVLEGIRGLEKH